MIIFAPVMKRFLFFTIYWMLGLLLFAAILCSMDYRMPEALLLSTSILPVAILLRQMLARVSLAADRREVVSSLIFILLFILTMTFLVVHLAHATILYIYRQMPTTELSVPPMLLNPVFLLSMLILLTIGDYALTDFLKRYVPETDDTITFISDRQSMTLARHEILYVESRDTEVWIYATDGRCFRNKTAISSWARLLGSDYLRIHRSYLVRLSACSGMESDTILLGDVHLPVSRKYKAMVQRYIKM